jgi:Na+-transporting methylmalonyl-CoA/oxaloacetate decarboxylase gamma subunit
MRNLISGFIYFVVGSSILLIILIIVVTFTSGMFDFIGPVSLSSEAREADADAGGAVPEEETTDEPETQALRGAERLSAAAAYEGGLELPVNGATGYAAADTAVYNVRRDSIITGIDPGEAFLIMQEDGEWWRVTVAGRNHIVGWVRHEHCLINLPDVIPSIIYKGSGSGNENENGEENGGRVWNERLKRYEHIVPVRYEEAKQIYLAQSDALANNTTLVICGEINLAKAEGRHYMLAGEYRYPRLRYRADAGFEPPPRDLAAAIDRGGLFDTTVCLSVAPG